MTVNITWNNYGVAPVYEQWNVSFSLVSNVSSVVARWTSGINIRTLMPASPVTFNDKFDVSRVQTGNYALWLQIVDPRNFNKPLGLAIRGADVNNVYTFQSIQIDASAPATDSPYDPATSPDSSITNQAPEVVSSTATNGVSCEPCGGARILVLTLHFVTEQHNVGPYH